MSKSTPGPWRTWAPGKEQLRVYTEGKGMELIATPAYRRNPAEEAANACLIAAAPELLEALKECLPYFEAACNRNLNDWRTVDATKEEAAAGLARALKYRAAIAKATGEAA